MSLITPEEIRRKGLRYWDSGRAARAALGCDGLFPLEIPFGKLPSGALLERFVEVRQWLAELRRTSKAERGYGYALDFREVSHRTLGAQQLPRRIWFETAEDLFRYIGKWRDYQRLEELAASIRQAQPDLTDWVLGYPLKVLEHGDALPRLLATLAFFQAHPRPDRYLRELDIPGVDTKFVEQHQGLLRDLLDRVLPAAAIDESVNGLTGSGFERRYGLRYDQPLIRFRLLDPALARPWGLTDLSVPLEDFRRLQPPCERVVITENKVNGLSFPPLRQGLVIFGLGYGITALKDVPWLAEMAVYYWGDLDTHGFAMLSQVRSYLPQTRSLLMDRSTLEQCRALWTQEDAAKRFTGELSNLSEAEQVLFRDLRDDRLVERVRLEQERIPFDRVVRCVAELL